MRLNRNLAKGDAEDKIWLEPECKVSFLYEFTLVEEKILVEIIVDHYEYFKRAWDEHFK